MYTKNMPGMRLSNLGRKLVENGLMAEEQAIEAMAKASEKGRTFTSHLVREKLIDAKGFALVASEDFGIPVIDLSAVNLNEAPTDVVAEDLLRKHLILPLRQRGKRLFVAVADPSNKSGLDSIAFSTGLSIEPILAAYNTMEGAIDRAMSGSTQAFTELTEEEDDLDNLKFDTSSDEADRDSSDTAGSDDAPVVRFVNKVLIDAIRKGASDIHFEPYEEDYRVRFRVDGVLITQAHGAATGCSPEGHVQPRYRRTTRAPGWPYQTQHFQEPGLRLSCLDLPDAVG
jgi:type IV pilus assembly protein PilB